MCGQLNFLKKCWIALRSNRDPPSDPETYPCKYRNFYFLHSVCFKGLGRLEPRDLSPAMACPAQIRACSLVKAGVAQTRRS